MRELLPIALAATLSGTLCLACNDPTATYSQQAIPLELAGTGGGLLGVGTVETEPSVSGAGVSFTGLPLLVDTGAPVTAFNDDTGETVATRGALTLSARSASAAAAPRLRYDGIRLFATPIGATGLDAVTFLGGVLGGDNLQRFVLGLRYTPSPQLTITDNLISTDCELSERCTAVLPFQLAGGRQQIDLRDDVYDYAASYILVDACVEPAADPLKDQLPCNTRGECADERVCSGTPENIAACLEDIRVCRESRVRYLPQGIDVRFAVATGFPGLALTVSAYDRLRGRGAGEVLVALGGHTLYLPGQLEGGIGVGVAELGTTPTTRSDPAARAAITLVEPDGYFGACASLARSRRLRAQPEDRGNEAEVCLRNPTRYPDDALLVACSGATNNSPNCNDATDEAHTNAYVELAAPVPVIIVPDTTSLLQSINADARPQSATVEGVIGTELLRRLGTTIDYPNRRLVMSCQDASCRAFPRTGHSTECGAPSDELVFGGGAARTFSAVPGGAAIGCALP